MSARTAFLAVATLVAMGHLSPGLAAANAEAAGGRSDFTILGDLKRQGFDCGMTGGGFVCSKGGKTYSCEGGHWLDKCTLISIKVGPSESGGPFTSPGHLATGGGAKVAKGLDSSRLGRSITGSAMDAPEPGPVAPGEPAAEPAEIVRLVDVTAETGRRVVGRVTSWQTKDGPYTVEHLAGRDASGNLIVFYWSPKNGRWKAVDATAEAGHRVAGELTSWQTKDGPYTVEHLAGRDASGNLIVFYWSPRSGRWKAVNVTRKTGQKIADTVTSWQTPNGPYNVEHLAGRNTAGDLIVFWWSPARDWQALNVSQKTGRRIASPVASWQVRRGGVLTEYLAATTSDDRVIEFSWRPDQDWRADDLTTRTGRRVEGGLTPWRTGPVEHLAGMAPDGSLVTLWRNGTGAWRSVDVTGLTGASIEGRPTVYQLREGRENVELLGARNTAGELLLYWWKPSRDWQVINLSEITGEALSGAPEGWLTRSATGTVEHLAAVADDGHLLVLWGLHQPRRFTDALTTAYPPIQRMRNVRRKVMVILWDPHWSQGRASASRIESRVFGATNSVRDYYLENSMGLFTIENAGVHGWYEAPMPADWYDGQGSRDKGVAALRAADPDVDFARFDTNGDGRIGHDELAVVFVHPGRNGGIGGLNRVGGRALQDDDGSPLEVDGVALSEIVEIGIGNPPNIGIVAHELAHFLLGAGDMYISGFFSPSKAAQYSIMDQHEPTGPFDPFHKLKAGWLRPKIVFEGGDYTLPAVEGSNEVLVLMDPARGPREYFIVENRWPGMYGQRLFDRGLAVWHVIEAPGDYNAALPPPNVSVADWVSLGNGNWGRKAVRMIRPVVTPPLNDNKALWDGSDPETGYDLESSDTDPAHAELRWGDGTPSGFAIRLIGPAGPEVTMTIEVP